MLIAGMDAVMNDPVSESTGRCALAEPPRLRRPNREQSLLLPCCLEDLLPADHAARAVWSVVERLDLSAFSAPLKARGDEPGRPATDPQLLTALWLYATIEGIGSGREIERRCGCQDAFRWLCGGVPVNYHTLNDFRVGHGAALDELFSQVLAVLMHKRIVSVRRIAQDGTKVRADAGRHTFRREATLQRQLTEARAHVAAVKAQSDNPAADARRRAAQERAARERVERIEAALAELPKIGADQQQSKRPDVRAKEPRASTIDPQARVMKMPDGGYRPAYNVQLATDVESRAIVGVDVTQARSDHQQAAPLRAQVERRSGAKVVEHLLDGGYVQLAEIERAEAAGTRIYAPPQKTGNDTAGFAPKRSDGPGVAAWRVRMGTPAGQTIYKQRASTAEPVNADLKRYRGLAQCVVRGLAKVRCQALWAALAYNVMHFAAQLVT
ncbi:Transposase DDE domain protein [Phycisphaerae bacterium RAS1]|nr:Transposase DDE domain protein [Phycisphaerae bacterium RAS1]TWT46316.1 Transposase DDE domain protein [Phycisphaerae bacterium RAS1]